MTKDNDWIYENRVLFNLLTEQEKEELRAHKQRYVCFVEGRWVSCIIGDHDLVYRAVRPALVMPSINWDEVAEGWNWLVITSQDDGVICANKPVAKNFGWEFDGHNVTLASAFKSFKRGNVLAEQWRDSLVTRSEGA